MKWATILLSCAWLVWAHLSSGEWRRIGAYETKAACERRVEESRTKQDHYVNRGFADVRNWINWECWPSDFDPRAPKAK